MQQRRVGKVYDAILTGELKEITIVDQPLGDDGGESGLREIGGAGGAGRRRSLALSRCRFTTVSPSPG